MDQIQELRDKNRATVYRFFQLHGEERGELFDEDGCKEPTRYENHYVFCFRMKDGKILEMREINNPLMLMQAFGVELPKMPDAREDTERLLNQ